MNITVTGEYTHNGTTYTMKDLVLCINIIKNGNYHVSLTREWPIQYILIQLVKTFFRTDAVHSADATTEMQENICCKAEWLQIPFSHGPRN